MENKPKTSENGETPLFYSCTDQAGARLEFSTISPYDF